LSLSKRSPLSRRSRYVLGHANNQNSLLIKSNSQTDEINASVENPTSSPNLKVKITPQFPQSEVFGVKLVNNHPTQCVLSIHNEEPAPVSLQFVGGSLLTPMGVPGAPSPPSIIRNLTTTRYGALIPAGESETFTYSFANEMHPQDLTLNLAAIIQNSEEKIFTMQFYNETVTVVEAPSSIFDPQM